MIGKPTGEQEPRGVSVSRCKACWLRICLDKFVLEPNTRDVIQQHYLPLIVDSSGVALPIAFNTASSPSTRPNIPNKNTQHQLLHQLLVKKEHEAVPPPLPLPCRKRRITVKDTSGLFVMPEDSRESNSTTINFNSSHLPPNHAFLLIGNNLVSASSLPPGTTIVMAPSNSVSKEKKGKRREDTNKRTRNTEDGLKRRKKTSALDSLVVETEVEEVHSKKRRRRKAKGFLTHNLDHDYGGQYSDDKESDDNILEGSTTINDVIDEQGLIYSNTIEEVVVKMETTEDLESNYSTSSHNSSPPICSPTTGVILRESSNEDCRGRLGSIGAANAHTLMNLSLRLGIHRVDRVDPESPKPGTKAEEVPQAVVDPNLYSTVVMGSAALNVGKKKREPQKRKPANKRLNQQENRSSVKKRSSASSMSSLNCFDSKIDHDLSSIHDSLHGFLTDQHHVNRKRSRLHHQNSRLHNHSSTTLSHLHHRIDDDEDSQEDMSGGIEESVEDDEGYDDYFDPVAVREARDSLFFDEILNTNSPFL